MRGNGDLAGKKQGGGPLRYPTAGRIQPGGPFPPSHTPTHTSTHPSRPSLPFFSQNSRMDGYLWPIMSQVTQVTVSYRTMPCHATLHGIWHYCLLTALVTNEIPKGPTTMGKVRWRTYYGISTSRISYQSSKRRRAEYLTEETQEISGSDYGLFPGEEGWGGGRQFFTGVPQ